MKFCPDCGSPNEQRIPAGDDRERAVCTACGTVHYVNPRAVVGCVVEHEGSLLLCRRAIEPAHGKWTMPAGFLEIGESLVEGARRETREEACAEVEVLAPFAQLDLPHIGQHYALYRARMTRPEFAAGIESLEVRLFGLDEIPWDELAFPVVHFALRFYLDDLRADRQQLHLGVLRWLGTGSRYDARNYEVDEHLPVPLHSPPHGSASEE